MKEVNQALLRGILEQAECLSWTVQGFGMVRTYLDDAHRWRLNIWDDRLQTPGVSLIHDHPWSFTSHVLAGRIVNMRYGVDDSGAHALTHEYKRIVTGPDGGDASPVLGCRLVPRKPEVYPAGTSYRQQLTEVHETRAVRGTVTLNDRTPPTREYTARVFWPTGYLWMAARPRPARWSEVEGAVRMALALL